MSWPAIMAAGEVGGALFIGSLLLALLCVIEGIVIACTKTRNRWLLAALVGLGLPLVFVCIAFAGCGMALGFGR